MRFQQCLFYFLAGALLITGLADCASGPPRTIRLPPVLKEASGLSVTGGTFTWHNDSGDGPFLYQTDTTGKLLGVDTLQAIAVDYEDITRDPEGNLYVGDFGNNAGHRPRQAIYRYAPATGKTDTILFTYPAQSGRGRGFPGVYDCEAMIYQNGRLHLFTKDRLSGRKRYTTYHFRLAARPGVQIAELVDSLHLPRRVVTAAALDSVRRELVLTAYNFKWFAGFWPTGSASLITLSDYPEGRFLRGRIHRKNLSWWLPTQFEAVDFYNEKWLYVASEGTLLRPRATAKRKRRRLPTSKKTP